MISKVLKCSRAFPLGSVGSWYQVETDSGAEILIFVNIKQVFFDVLVFKVEKLYFCRYQFPRFSWYEEDIVEYLKKEI